MKLSSFVILAFNVLSCLSLGYDDENFSEFSSHADPVDKLNLTFYAGHWYQMYSNLLVIKSTQKHAICTQVNYKIVSNERLSAESYYRKYNPHGDLVVSNGSIFQPRLENPGILKLKLNNIPYPTPYVVIKLGPLSENQYEYSVVTDDDSASLYVYARSLKWFRQKYQEEVLKFCETSGFTSYYNKPVETPQPTPCAHAMEFSSFSKEKFDECGYSRPSEFQLD